MKLNRNTPCHKIGLFYLRFTFNKTYIHVWGLHLSFIIWSSSFVIKWNWRRCWIWTTSSRIIGQSYLAVLWRERTYLKELTGFLMIFPVEYLRWIRVCCCYKCLNFDWLAVWLSSNCKLCVYITLLCEESLNIFIIFIISLNLCIWLYFCILNVVVNHTSLYISKLVNCSVIWLISAVALYVNVHVQNTQVRIVNLFAICQF